MQIHPFAPPLRLPQHTFHLQLALLSPFPGALASPGELVRSRMLREPAPDVKWSVYFVSVLGRRKNICPPDVAHLGPVLQKPAVGDFVLPAHIPGVLPQQSDLVTSVPCVP